MPTLLMFELPPERRYSNRARTRPSNKRHARPDNDRLSLEVRRCGFNDSVTVTLFVRHAPAEDGTSRQTRARAHPADPAKARLHAAARKSERD